MGWRMGCESRGRHQQFVGGYVMYTNTESFKGDISHWDVSSVMDMSYMFSNAQSSSSVLADWNTASVTSMSSVFQTSKTSVPTFQDGTRSRSQSCNTWLMLLTIFFVWSFEVIAPDYRHVPLPDNAPHRSDFYRCFHLRLLFAHSRWLERILRLST